VLKKVASAASVMPLKILPREVQQTEVVL